MHNTLGIYEECWLTMQTVLLLLQGVAIDSMEMILYRVLLMLSRQFISI